MCVCGCVGVCVCVYLCASVRLHFCAHNEILEDPFDPKQLGKVSTIKKLVSKHIYFIFQLKPVFFEISCRIM